ncbi:GtrA family protein [Roseateles sp. So40a]|uniref:GtrA family protein n=1 Tax=Roseateles sp. So40a TaxID=3400226 RepID=UPI003A83A9E2
MHCCWPTVRWRMRTADSRSPRSEPAQDLGASADLAVDHTLAAAANARPLRFLLVGVAATMVHWVVVAATVSTFGWEPLRANLVAWLTAAGVSFIGHQRWTFGSRRAATRSAAPRFLVVSLAGFVLNQVMFASLLRWTEFQYGTALAVVLLLTASVTYLASNLWAFSAPLGRP